MVRVHLPSHPLVSILVGKWMVGEGLSEVAEDDKRYQQEGLVNKKDGGIVSVDGWFLGRIQSVRPRTSDWFNLNARAKGDSFNVKHGRVKAQSYSEARTHLLLPKSQPSKQHSWCVVCVLGVWTVIRRKCRGMSKPTGAHKAHQHLRVESTCGDSERLIDEVQRISIKEPASQTLPRTPCP